MQAIRWCWAIKYILICSLMLTACRPQPQPPRLTAATPTTAQRPRPSISTPRLTPTSTSEPIAAATTAPTPVTHTAEILTDTILPVRDLDELAVRFKSTAKTGQAAPLQPEHHFVLDDRETFWVTDNSSGTPEQFQIDTTLVYMTDHAYWWIQTGYQIPEINLIVSAEKFESQIYPTTREHFGSEWSPGIDGDIRLHVVLGRVPGVAGYYASSNEYSRFANEYSNEREMFLINLDAVQPGSDYFDSILAHEFQHMIHWHEDPNEDTWLNEGLSELARYINGFGLSSFADVYLAQPDLQLTAWGADAASRNAHYGSGFLFSTYLFDQYGSEVIRAIMAQPENGVAGIEKALAAQGTDTTFDNVFADFIVANYLNDPQLAEGQWGYHQPDFTLALPEFAARHTQFPVEVTDTVHQYGVDYIYLDAIPADLTLSFQGNPTVSLLDTQPYSGQHFWYSNRGDSIDTTLTRTFDLRELTTATLQFWAWYEIEASWDYAYVAVSVDGGQTWRTLPATTTTDANPVGMGYGPGFSGQSHGWLEQTVDLTPFAGQLIELRFEYITDDAVNAPGLAIDNIRLTELNYHEDAETPASGWQAEGFIRTDNVVSQRFIIQLIQLNQAGQVRVSRLPLDALNQGKIKLTGQEDSSVSIILVISAQAPVTTSLAQYSYTLTK